MGLYKYPLRPLDDFDLANYTYGKVREYLNEILSIPEYGKIPLAGPVVTAQLDELEKTTHELYDGIEKSTEEDPSKFGTAQYSSALEHGYETGDIDRLVALLYQVDTKQLNDVQKFKVRMLGLAVEAEMSGFASLLDVMKEFRKWIKDHAED